MQGGTLFQVLDDVEPLPRDPLAPFRMSVIDRFKDMGTIAMGKSEAGLVRKNDRLYVMPNKCAWSLCLEDPQGCTQDLPAELGCASAWEICTARVDCLSRCAQQAGCICAFPTMSCRCCGAFDTLGHEASRPLFGSVP